MDYRGNKCKICNRNYHICSSCDSQDEFYYDNLCSKECWRKSNEVNEYVNEAIKFYDSLSIKQKETFGYLLDEADEYLIDEICRTLNER